MFYIALGIVAGEAFVRMRESSPRNEQPGIGNRESAIVAAVPIADCRRPIPGG